MASEHLALNPSVIIGPPCLAGQWPQAVAHSQALDSAAGDNFSCMTTVSVLYHSYTLRWPAPASSVQCYS